MPPSERATFHRGYRSGTRAHSQSAVETIPLTGNSVVLSSSGAPGDPPADHADDPVCRQITVSVSSHAASSGSQYAVYSDGMPMWCGFSGKLNALNPLAELRSTSWAATAGSFSHVICNGMIRSGYVPAQTSWCQSFHARTHASPTS